MSVTKLFNNTTLRIVTGIIIGILVLSCVIAGGIPLMLLVTYVAYIGSKEYVDILQKNTTFVPNIPYCVEKELKRVLTNYP